VQFSNVNPHSSVIHSYERWFSGSHFCNDVLKRRRTNHRKITVLRVVDLKLWSLELLIKDPAVWLAEGYLALKVDQSG